MDFDAFIGKGWDDHATDAHAVAMRLGKGLALVRQEADIPRWTALAAHVWGEHLGNWQAGIADLQRVCTLPAFQADGPSGQAWRRTQASLVLAGGGRDGTDGMDGSVGPDGTDALERLSPSDRIRALAMAASHLVAHDATRAGRLLQEALDLAQRSALPPDDPMNRALAATGNTMACALEEQPQRSPAERDLMVLAARTSRHYWERAGTWLEVERAEYRLARTWLQAGDLAQARSHAQACLATIAANDGAALEQLFGWEALGLVERAAGDAAGHARALARARAAFDALADADKRWCAASITKLEMLPPEPQAVVTI